MWSDLVNLPREVLRDICINLGLPEKGSVDELCERIWPKIKGDKELQNRVLSNAKSNLFGGKTSVTWFTFDKGDLAGLKDRVISSLPYNPFECLRVPDAQDITSEPVIISGAVGETKDEYYLRFMYRIGNARYTYGMDMEYRPRTEITTVYFNESKDFIEVRTEPKKAEKVARSLAMLTQQQISLEQVRVAAPFGFNTELIADALGGELIDQKAKPELLLENFSEEQAKAVVDILSALDTYFGNENFDMLRDALERTKEKFGEEFLAIPFTALILNGLDKIGMGVTDGDLRGRPLYDFLRPHLQPQGGYVRFPFTENGITKIHTIRIGLTTNSIQFVSAATEGVFGYVRDRLLAL
jgi:hypothetical protein